LQSGHKFTTNNEVSLSFWTKMPGYEGECGKMAAILKWLCSRSIFFHQHTQVSSLYLCINFYLNRRRGCWDLRHRLKFSMVAILKILKGACTHLGHLPHPQKVSFGLV
jgi:hypothetical protein